MPIKVSVSNQTAHFLDMVFTLGLGIVSLYISIFVASATRQESVFLVLASIVHFYFFKKAFQNEVNLWSWSLPTIIWAIPAYYSIWMIIKYLL
ncbi:MAG: hypothetical protein IH589_07295 [Anaerolineales bacterium]|nr:hypothetical protein [Anaerolineales bacterium]